LLNNFDAASFDKRELRGRINGSEFAAADPGHGGTNPSFLAAAK